MSLTDGVELPQLCPVLALEVCLEALRLLDLVVDFTLPGYTFRLGGRPQIEFARDSFDKQLEAALLSFIGNDSATVLIEIDDT